MAEVSPDQWLAIIEPLLKGIDRYNPENVGKLQRYLEFQAASGCYNFEANLTLIKLYQFNVPQFDVQMVSLALLKALMQLPENEFTLLKYLIPSNRFDDPDLKPVFEMHRLLENCSFVEFWTFIKKYQPLLQQVTGFEEAIRTYISGLLTITYQHVSSSYISDSLGLQTEVELEAVAAANGWKRTTDGDQFFLHNQEEHVRPKKIISRIEFESVSSILASADY